MALTAQQIEIINAFASANKINRTKLQAMVDAVVNVGPKRGRKMSDESVSLLNNIKAIEDKKETFTTKQLAARFGAQQVYVSNALNRLEKDKIVVRVGVAERAPGQRGKNATVWAFVQK